mgnify:FL=1
MIYFPSNQPNAGTISFSDKEIEIQREITRHFIAADLFEIVFHRSVKVETSDGGYRWEEMNATEVQNVRIVPQINKDEEQANDGTVVVSDLVVVGEYNFSVFIGDIFEWKSGIWKIVSVDDSPSYIQKAEAIRYEQ